MSCVAFQAIGFHVALIFIETVIGAFFFFACRSRIARNENAKHKRRQSVSFRSPPRQKIEVKYSTPVRTEANADVREHQIRPSFQIGGSEEIREKRRNCKA